MRLEIFRRPFRAGAFLLAAVLAFASAPPLHAQQTVLSMDEARQLGFALADQGQPVAAAQIAQSLLARNDQDAGAWLLLARAARVGGDADAALEAAGNANRYARSDTERYAASMELAAANFALERPLRAQFWLRRAAQLAPTEALRASAIRNFRQVRARSPWAISLGFRAVPSSNVNNGSREDTIVIAGLPFTLSGDAQALSGIEFALSGSARYRFIGLGDRPAQLSFGALVQRVRLSDEARDQAPDAENSDYAYTALEIGFTQILSGAESDQLWRLESSLGRNWYGGEPLSRYARIGATTEWPTGERMVAGISASVERQLRDDREERSAWIARIDARHSWALENGGALTLSAGLRNTNAQSSEIDHLARSIGLSYRHGQRLFDVATLETSISYENRDYDRSPYSADGRQDDRLRFSATFGFPDWNYYGFAPTLTLDAQRVSSNISLYDTDDYGISFGIRSVF